MVAALAETQVPVLQRDGIDEATFTALRAGLTSEVQRLAEMAMPELPRSDEASPARRTATSCSTDSTTEEDAMKIDSKTFVEYAKTAAISILDDLVETDPTTATTWCPVELRRFLAGLRLLKGVPFSYLVPDADLLPPESIRFFYLDRNWTDAVVQGVLSVGTITTTDRAQLETVYPTLRAEVDATERTVREPTKTPKPLRGGGGTITGFLLRSRAVSGWPALHVRAYSARRRQGRAS